ncbi:hypothetical protein [Clostridium massiliodielmoense]|uniref:hypothetical protein n=1 Tax=Clostridium massiliodielmoense TaxID=1776385 RepID=UPI000A26DF9A|nr:hypothetical protein [Clostridium massiliodielmoense]
MKNVKFSAYGFLEMVITNIPNNLKKGELIENLRRFFIPNETHFSNVFLKKITDKEELDYLLNLSEEEVYSYEDILKKIS